MLLTLIVLALCAVMFAIGKIRSDVVALCALIVLMVSGILTPDEALSGFSNSVVIMMVGLFVVGGAIFQTGLAKMISGRIMRLAGDSELRLFLLVMAVTSAIGAFVSNTGTVALMLPIVVSLAAKAHVNASRLLMPLAFASSLGGMLTLIGTPPNLVIQDALTSAGLEPLSFFSFTPVGLACIVVGTAVLLPLSKWFLDKRADKDKDERAKVKSLEQLVDEYRIADNLSRYTVGHDSKIKGKTIVELDIHNRYGLTVLEVRRETLRQKGLLKSVNQMLAGPHTVLQENDIIYVTGEKESAQRFADDYALLAPVKPTSGADGQGGLDFYDIGMAEIVLMPTSQLVNRRVKESGFRSKYGINIVGIRRKGEYIMDDLADLHLHSGDVLLVQGTWASISRLGNEEEKWVVLGQPLEEAAKVTLD